VSGFASIVLVEPSLSHLARAFTYGIPDGLALDVGAVVRVPFRRRRRTGVVIALMAEPDVDRPLAVFGALGPGIEPQGVALAEWVAGRYLSTFGEALAAVIPTRVASEEKAVSAAESAEAVGAPFADLRQGFAAYSEGGRLVRALETGGGEFVWRPRASSARGEAVCAMVATVVARGAGALVLVPEVRVGGEVAAALRRAFGDDALALLGADRSGRARYRDWLALRSGEKRIAVGSRSAVFAPVRDLGLVVVDDEASAAYKEARAPRFHARTVAVERAARAGATLVLVGVPPSVEARSATARGPFVLVAPERAREMRDRPPVTVVDMRAEGSGLVPSAPTLRSAAVELQAGRRIVLLAHRSAEDLASVADRAGRILAPAAVVRLDASATRAQVRAAVRSAQCIVSTPFIAKDLAIEGVGMLAILDADAALSSPEFRAAEECFGTWWRASRFAVGGRVVLESLNPRQAAIVALTRWDPDVLYRAEAARRKELGYPPFAALARIDVPAERAEEAARAVTQASEALEVLGPAESGGRWVIVVRARRRQELLDALGPLAARWRSEGEPMRVDVDPWEVLVPKWRSCPS